MDIIKALEKARELKLENKVLRLEEDIVIAPQVEEGKSIWARFLKEGFLDQYNVMWAFKDTEPKEWLALRVEIPDERFTFSRQPKDKERNKGNIFYFNLKNSRDRQALKQLEKELESHLKTKVKWLNSL